MEEMKKLDKRRQQNIDQVRYKLFRFRFGFDNSNLRLKIHVVWRGHIY